MTDDAPTQITFDIEAEKAGNVRDLRVLADQAKAAHAQLKKDQVARRKAIRKEHSKALGEAAKTLAKANRAYYSALNDARV